MKKKSSFDKIIDKLVDHKKRLLFLYHEHNLNNRPTSAERRLSEARLMQEVIEFIHAQKKQSDRLLKHRELIGKAMKSLVPAMSTKYENEEI